MIEYKAYRFRLVPTAAQKVSFAKAAGTRRWVWNWALSRKIEFYKETGKSISWVDLSKELTKLKNTEEFCWLWEVSADIPQQVLIDLDRAFAAFFDKRAGFPNYRSKHGSQPTFRIPKGIKINGNRVYIPKIGWVRFRNSRKIGSEKLKSLTVTQEADGNWYISIIVEFELPDVPAPSPKKPVGIDLGLTDIVVTSDGNKTKAPRNYRKAQGRLARQQRALSRKQKGSKRRAKQRKKVARTHRKVRNQRLDFTHKLTTDLVEHYDLICAETLNLKGMSRTKLAKSVYDASLGMVLSQLKYKSRWRYQHFVQIDRWYPSSKLHAGCGYINDQLQRSDRDWTCQCGEVLDRDLNAAKNILLEGQRLLAVGHTESLNARGADVRPSGTPLKAVGYETRIQRL